MKKHITFWFLKSVFILLSFINYAKADWVNTGNVYTVNLASNTIYVNGNIINNSGSIISNEGMIFTKGDLTNNGSIVTSGTFKFNGTSQQTISGETDFENLTIDNNSTGVFLSDVISSNISVNGILTFVNGKFILGNNNFVITSSGSITGEGSTNHIVTNSTGTLTRNGILGSSNFPVGDGTNYMPVTFSSNISRDFSVRIKDPSAGLDISKALSKVWKIDASGAATIAPTFTWTSVLQGVSFPSTTASLLKYNGSIWANTGLTSSISSYTASFTGALCCSEFTPGDMGDCTGVTYVNIESNPAAPPIVCEGVPVTFSVNSVNGGSPWNYQWKVGSSNAPGTSTNSTYSINPNVGDAGIYTCVASNCAGTGITTSNGIVLTVNSAPSIPVITGNHDICAISGNSVTYTSDATNCTYNWASSNPDVIAITSSLNVAIITVEASVAGAGTGNITLTVTDLNNCGSVASYPFTVNSYITSGNPTGATANPSTISSGQSSTLTLNGGGGGTNTQIKWYTTSCGGTPVSGNIVNPTSTTTYYGRYEDPTPCNNNTNCQSVTVNVGACTPPSISSHPEGAIKCIGNSVTFTVTASGTATLSYKWYKKTVIPPISGATKSTYSISSITNADANQYYCVVSNTCGSTVSTAAVLTINTVNITGQPGNITLPPNSGPAYFNVAATGSNLSYQWQEDNNTNNFTDLADGGNYTSVTTSDLYILTVTSGMNNYKYRCKVTNECGSSYSNAGTLNVQTISGGLWIGATSVDWNTTSNWAGLPSGAPNYGLPISTTDITIQPARFQPAITDGENGNCNNITINPNASIKVSGTGTLTALGSLWIQSNSSGTGALSVTGTCGNVSISGNVRVDNYLPGIGYHYIGSPISNATLSQVNATVALKNLNCSHYDPAHPPTADKMPNIWMLDEKNSSASNDQDMNAWMAPCSTTATMTPMRGFALVDPSANATIHYTGGPNTLNCGNISFQDIWGTPSLTKYGNGCNFVSNPYPSPIDWNLVCADHQSYNIGSTAYFFYPTSQYYGAWGIYQALPFPISTGAYPHSRYIPSMQGFYVFATANSNASLTFRNSYRTVDAGAMGQAFFKKTESNNTYPSLRIRGGNIKYPDLSDEAFIYFNNNATEKFDVKYDGLKLMNTDPQMPNIFTISRENGTESSENNFVVNALPEVRNDLIIPLAYMVSEPGKYNIKATDINNFDAGTNIYLVDMKKGITQDLAIEPSYSFNTEPGDDKRFFIKFGNQRTGLGENTSSELCNIYTSDNNLFVNYNNQENKNAILNIYSITGQIIKSDVSIKNGTYHTTLDIAQGTYFVKIISDSRVYVQKVFVK